VYRHYRSQISSCHSSVTRGGQDVSGIIRVRVRIGADGHVVRTRVLENTTRSEPLATCVQNQIRTWRYPAPEGGEVEVDYPLGFGN
jgi:outer membrane biosynthesis protein TonB